VQKYWGRTHEFDDPYITKTLYCAFVRPIMEYGSVVWNPYELGDIAQIESIQKQFLLYALRGLGWRTDTYSLPSYESRLKLINLETLEFRRFKTDMLFAFDLLRRNIFSDVLCDKLQRNENGRHLRHSPFLVIPRHRTSYGSNEPLTRIARNFNQQQRNYDGTISRLKFKKLIVYN
jgi:hypothetical protein